MSGKILWIVIACLCLVPAAVLSAPGDILTSFVPATGSDDCNAGLAFDGTHLWLTQRPRSVIFQLTTEGALVRTIDPLPGRRIGALDWDGEHLWAGTYDQEPPAVFEIDPAGSGAILRSFPLMFIAPSPWGGPSGLGGLAFDSATATLWCSEPMGTTVYQIDGNGNVLSSFSMQELAEFGVYGNAVDGRCLWTGIPCPIIPDARQQGAGTGLRMQEWGFVQTDRLGLELGFVPFLPSFPTTDIAYDGATFSRPAIWAGTALCGATGMPPSPVYAVEAIPCSGPDEDEDEDGDEERD
jgi:hypothetical protein